MKSFHPAANIFPLMRGAEFDALQRDVEANGLRVVITLHPDGSILDGRNRALACEAAGVEPRYETWDGEIGTELAFVLSLNLARRHLDESQRAMVATRIATLPHGGAMYATSDAQICAPSQDEAADLLNVARRSVQSARVVVVHGVPELVEACEQGRTNVSQGAKIAKLEEEIQRDIVGKINDGMSPAKAMKQEKADARAERARWSGDYSVIYADPPWQYSNTGVSGSASQQYPTMPTSELCTLLDDIELPVADDAVLFMWVTNPLLEEAFDVLKSWGFSYKTNICWVKKRAGGGIGFYVASHHELLLIATLGSMLPFGDAASSVSSVLDVASREHSRKPDEAAGVIDRLYPGAHKVELFSRQPREGWDAWGNDTEKFGK